MKPCVGTLPKHANKRIIRRPPKVCRRFFQVVFGTHVLTGSGLEERPMFDRTGPMPKLRQSHQTPLRHTSHASCTPRTSAQGPRLLKLSLGIWEGDPSLPIHLRTCIVQARRSTHVHPHVRGTSVVKSRCIDETSQAPAAAAFCH